MQALQRRAHAPRTKDCKQLNTAIRHMERHICGPRSITINHPSKLVAFIDAAFTAHPEEPTGLAFRGLVARLQEDDCAGEPNGICGKAYLVDSASSR